VACAVFESVGDRASVQVVGGLSAEQAVALARKGLRAFVISGNLGLPDARSRYGLPGGEIERHKFPPPVERGPLFRQMSCCLYDVDIASLPFSRLVANTPGTASLNLSAWPPS